MRPIAASLLWLLVSVSSVARDRTEPVLTSALLPHYPHIAATAHITGDVRAAFRVASNGDVSSVETASGHRILQRETERNIRTWKFSPAESDMTEMKLETTFTYKLTDGCAQNSIEDQTITVTVRSFRHVEIQAVPRCVQTSQGQQKP
jgi:TonB family protein